MTIMYHNSADCRQGNSMFAGFNDSGGKTNAVRTKASNANASL